MHGQWPPYGLALSLPITVESSPGWQEAFHFYLNLGAGRQLIKW